jgi:hypothetical protein
MILSQSPQYCRPWKKYIPENFAFMKHYSSIPSIYDAGFRPVDPDFFKILMPSMLDRALHIG